jgi:flagellar basal-body rod modification protein FlgD
MDITALADIPRYDPNATQAAEAGDELGQDAFLRLLTTQLQNQDPSSPVENEAFIAQLAQFSSLEQLIGLQETMDNVYLGIATMNNSSMTSLLGRDVVAVGDGFRMGDDGAVLHYEAAGAYGSKELTISVLNEAGDVVFSGELPAGDAGRHTFSWDGIDQDGQYAGAGDYRFVVSSTSDDAPEVRTLTVGRIDEMDFSQGTPVPSVNGVPVGLESILSLGDPG